MGGDKWPTIEILSEGETVNYEEALMCVQYSNDRGVADDLSMTKFKALDRSISGRKDASSDNGIFQYRTQEIWECKNNKMDANTKIRRFVNKLFTKNLNMRVYHSEGVKIGKLSKNINVIQVTEEKFIEISEGGNTVINYVGKVKLIIKAMIGTEQFFLSSKTFEVPRLNRESQDMLEIGEKTLDSMRIYANQKYSDNSLKTSLQDDFDMNESNKMRTYLVIEKARRILQLGRPWTETINDNRGVFKCFLLSTISGKQSNPELLPRVGEYIGDSVHTLPKDVFEELLEITNMNIYLCTNLIQEFFKVDLKYNIIPETVFAVRCYDTVRKVEHSKSSQQKKQLTIFETFYMDIMGRNVLKYHGQKIVDVLEPSPSSGSTFGFGKSGKNNK